MSSEDTLKRFIKTRILRKNRIIAKHFMKGVGNSYPSLIKSFYYLCKGKVDYEIADDIFQDALLKCYGAIQKKDTFLPLHKWNFTAYFTKALQWNLINYVNKEGKQVRTNSFITLDTDKHNNEEYYIMSVSPKANEEFYDLETNAESAAQQRDDEIEAEQRLNKLKITIAIKQLEPKFREIMSLHHYDNMKYREIARILDIPLTTVKTRLSTARRLLKIILQNERKKKR